MEFATTQELLISPEFWESGQAQISSKHMERYLGEFTFRQNHRERVNAMFDLMVGAL